MKILGIETSCDETATSVVEDGTKILSSVVASSLPLHAVSGGIIPEIAAREQLKAIIPVLETAIREAGLKAASIDAMAVTFGPGLIGSLLVGVETAKALSYVWNKPLVPVNHLVGHLYATWLENDAPPKFPLIVLIVSGGHTEIFLVTCHGYWKHLGGTRDDAAGETFDKMARFLGLGYPGGPAIAESSTKGTPTAYNLPRPLIDSNDYDFSFSGLKTAVINLVNKLNSKNAISKSRQNENLAACIQEAIVDCLVVKTIRAAQIFDIKNIVVGGGVAAYQTLRTKMISEFTGKVYFSAPKFSIDNAAMIASAAFFNYKPVSWKKIEVNAQILV